VITVVADTHALVWHLTDPKRLAPGARRAFRAVDSGRWMCHIPAIFFIELSLLHERSRVRVAPADVIAVLADHPGFAVLALDLEQAIEFGALPGVKDPMDRLVVAAARATRSRLISSDHRLDGYGVDRIWD
jgi:PIN domain nuclease of toxin-antitoxin system